MNETPITLKQFIAAPFLGLAFAIFLPLVGILMVGGLLLRKTFDYCMMYIAFSWTPCEAYLCKASRKKKK